MKPFFSCYHYPITVMCLDDDLNLLRSLKILLEESNPVRDFFSPFTAEAFLKKAALLAATEMQCTETHVIDENHIHQHLQSIQNLIYDARRFEEISTLVVDYFMPGMDGLTFCRNFQENAYVKIMLTGEADQSLAIAAFNEGVINQFIMKGDPQAIEKIINLVQKMQWQFFKEKTTFLVESLLHLDPRNFQYFNDPDFCEKIQLLLKEYAIQEFYLVNLAGNYLLIDKSKALWWMQIKTKQSIKTLIQETKSAFLQDPCPEAEAIYTQIASKEMQPLSALTNELPFNIQEWGEILVAPREIKTARETYQILIGRDIGKAALQYANIQYLQR